MPRAERTDIGEYVYHVLNRANARVQIFDNDQDYLMVVNTNIGGVKTDFKIKQNIDQVEQNVFQKEHRKSVSDISLIQRDIIGFQGIIESQSLVLKHLAQESEKFFGKKFVPYFNNVLNLHEQVNNLIDTRAKTLAAIDQTNQSLLTTRTNEIIRLLTIFSVIVFPLTLLAAVFGMNTKYLPFVGMKYDFWIISSIMVAGAFLMLALFKRKKWL